MTRAAPDAQDRRLGQEARLDALGEAQAAEERRRRNRWGAAAGPAAALAALGAFLFLPASLETAAAPITLFGAPMIWLYIFIVWIGLIGGAALLARAEADRDRRSGAELPKAAAAPGSDAAQP